MSSAVTIQKVTYIPFVFKMTCKNVSSEMTGRNSKHRPRRMLCLPHTHTHMLLSSVTNQGTNLVEVHRTFNSSETADMFHKKGRTCRRSPKYFFFDFRWWFFEVLPLFYASCEGTVWTLATSDRRWSKFESRNPLKRLRSTHDIVTERCFRYLMRFLCRSSPSPKQTFRQIIH